MAKIGIGTRLKTSRGEIVVVKKVTDNDVVVEYKNKLYRRNKSIIGQKLFFEEAKMYSKDKENQQTRVKSIDLDDKNYTCKNCMLYRIDDCFGEKEICGKFRKAPKPNKEVTKNWPRCGAATYYRFKNSKRHY